MAGGSGGMVRPGFAAQPTFRPAAPVGVPAFGSSSSTSSSSSSSDPRIADLTAQLAQQQNLPQAPNFAGINAQATQLQDLLKQLMRGEGINVGPVHNDPEAQAYSLAKTRELARSRESEAARQAASGIEGGGEFDARVAQLNEAKGENVAQFEGALSNRKKTEALNTATTGAGLQLQDLNRQSLAEQARYEAELNASQIDRQRKTDLLNVLMGQNKTATDNAYRYAEASPATKSALITAANPPPPQPWRIRSL